jgi:hypothetical protein
LRNNLEPSEIEVIYGEMHRSNGMLDYNAYAELGVQRKAL